MCVYVSPALEAAVARRLPCEARGSSQVSSSIRIARQPTELWFSVSASLPYLLNAVVL
jgi:hypothetical protein